MSNTELNALIKHAESEFGSASNKADLLAVVRRFCDYKGKLAFDYTWPIIGLVLGFMLLVPILASLFVASLQHVSDDTRSAFIGSGIAGLVAICVAGGIMFYASSKIPSLSERLLFKAALFGHRIKRCFDYDDALSRLQDNFADFDRGNYSREIQDSYSGVFNGNLHQLPFEYHKFEYVDQRTETTVVSDGKTSRVQTRVVYDHYYRYCVVVDFPWVRNVYVQNDGQKEFKHRVDTASAEFNRAFKVTGSVELDCVKFLKPVTVLHLQKMANIYGDLNLEFSNAGQLCMCFSNSDLLDTSPDDVDLTDPEGFYAALEKGVEFSNLMYALNQIHVLAEQHDNNFDEPLKVAQ